MKIKEIKTPEQMRDKGWYNAWLYNFGVEKEYKGIKYNHLIVSCNMCRTSPEYQIFTYPANSEGDRIALGDTPTRVWSLIPKTHKEEPEPFNEKWVREKREKIINDWILSLNESTSQ